MKHKKKQSWKLGDVFLVEIKDRTNVVGRDPATGAIVEMHQVGKQTKGGLPVSRERSALDDIESASKQRPQFHPYNKPY